MDEDTARRIGEALEAGLPDKELAIVSATDAIAHIGDGYLTMSQIPPETIEAVASVGGGIHVGLGAAHLDEEHPGWVWEIEPVPYKGWYSIQLLTAAPMGASGATRKILLIHNVMD